MRPRSLLALLLGLLSCRPLTIATYEDAGLRSTTFHAVGFDYEIYTSIHNNAPDRQLVGVVIRPTSGRMVEVANLKARLRWMEGGGRHAAIPYRALTIDLEPSGPDAPPFHRLERAAADGDAFDLARLSARLPAALRHTGPAPSSLSYQIEFAQPGLRCIPTSVDQMLVELELEAGVDGSIARYANATTLRPRRETMTEFYNLKSDAWSSNQCE
jgi:hypothetical protein